MAPDWPLVVVAGGGRRFARSRGTISKRVIGDEPDLCHSCYLGPDTVCASCGRARPSRQRGADAVGLCHACKPKVIENCCRYQRPKPVHGRWPLGPLCATCYSKIFDTPKECARCGEVRSCPPAMRTTQRSAAHAPASTPTPAAQLAGALVGTTHPASARTASRRPAARPAVRSRWRGPGARGPGDRNHRGRNTLRVNTYRAISPTLPRQGLRSNGVRAGHRDHCTQVGFLRRATTSRAYPRAKTLPSPEPSARCDRG